MAVAKCNGDDFLKVFKELNIELGNLNPNAVRAWFDTDEEKTINFLNFTCPSLTKDNILTAEELEDFKALKKPLHGNELETAIDKIEKSYPGIFDNKINSKKLKIYLEEIDQLNKEEEKLERLIEISKNTKGQLKQKSCLEKECAAIDFQLESTQSESQKLSENIEKIHQIVHKRITEDLLQICEFQVSESPTFLNRMNLGDIEESEEFDNSTQDVIQKQQADLSNFSENHNILNSTPIECNFESNLNSFETKIFSSYMQYYNARIEEVSISAAIDYLENFFVKGSAQYPKNNTISTLSLQAKIAEKEIVYSMFEIYVKSISEEPITSARISEAEKDLTTAQNNLSCFSQISEYYKNAFCITICTLMFFLQEKKTIENCDKFIQYISRYILDNLADSQERSELMLECINVYEEYKVKPIECRNKTIHNIMNLYHGSTLKEAYRKKKVLDKNLKNLYKNHFDQISELPEVVQKAYENNAVESFLNCGLTSRINIIPTEIQKSLTNIRSNLEKQGSAIKLILQLMIDTEKKLKSDNFLRKSRLLWMYFLVLPQKLKQFMLDLEEDLKAKEMKAVRFKD